MNRFESPTIGRSDIFNSEDSAVEQQAIEERLKLLDIDGFLADRKRNKLFNDGYEEDHETNKDVIEGLATLVLKLESKLDEYDTIIGDDVSGRLIALFLRRIIKAKRQEKDLPPPQSLFVAGGRTKFQAGKIRDYLDQKKDKIGKTLLVTEYISSGAGISWLAEIMKELGIDFDLATLSIMNSPSYYDNLPGISGRLYYGDSEKRAGVFFYNRKGLTGLRKTRDPRDLLPGEEVTAHAKRLQPSRYGAMKDARNTLYALADEIYDKLLSQ